MVDTTNYVFDERVQMLGRAISSIEGHSFGPHLRFFANEHYGLMHSCEGGWKECRDFGPTMPDIRDLANELNEATAPILRRYAVKLRATLAAECAKLAAEAAKPPTFSR